MKAIVKATHEVVELNNYDTDKEGNLYYYTEDYHKYHESEVELLFIKDYDYWEKLKHQYAGMAMQGMLSNTSLVSILFDATKDHDEMLKEVVICSHEYAHALVEMMKEERK